METLYTPLQTSDIRLISVLPAQADQPNAPLRLSMQQVPLTPETTYFALSYVWGDPKDSRTLLVNDVPFTTAVSTAAGSDVPSLSPDPPMFQWWTDAICINQADIDEKNAQVPRMGAIYTSALRVWIWLGYPEDVFPQDHGTSSQPFTPESSSPIFHRFLRQMSALMAHAWFERTWTIQEFVLSQNPPV
ncbi:hypothetical protein IQ07DRAFT_521135, partial [Pyrenochaeta sp. DS3sAY3a]